MKLGIIGRGAIGQYVLRQAQADGHEIAAMLLRSPRLPEAAAAMPGIACVDTVGDLPDDIEHMIDCAGHAALRSHGPAVLQRGIDLTTVSLGALADPALYDELEQSAAAGNARLHLASGAIGALDCLRAARVGNLHKVTYTGRKPPEGWRGSLAEKVLDLDRLTSGAAVHFSGTARDAAIDYPKNANVAAAVALAGIGFDNTAVQLIADADVNENIHEIVAEGAFGNFRFEVRGRALPDNPRSSALAAMSVISTLRDESGRIAF